MKYLLWISVAALAVFAGCKKDTPQSVASLTTTAATSITANTATSGGSITSNGGSPISKSGVCFAVHPSPTVSDSVTSDGTGNGTFTSSLTNLYAGTKYYVRAYAINGSGTAYGDEINFTTSPGVPAITTTVVSGIAPLVAYSGGNVVSDGGSAVTARGLVWATTAHPTIANSKSSTGTGVGTFTDSLYPLASNQVYYVRAYATNSSGTGYGNEYTLTSVSTDAVFDIDNNVYFTVSINGQTWMTSNLKVAHYRNGDPITDGSGNSTFYTGSIWYAGDNGGASPTTGAFTYPGNDPANNAKYGKYYDNLTITDARGICPTGWHIPTDDDWKALELFEGMSQADADNSGIPNRGTVAPKLLEGGYTGLNFQLGGEMVLTSSTGPATYFPFGNDGGYGKYWTSTLLYGDGIHANYWDRGFHIPSYDPNSIDRNLNEARAESVRCMKD